MHIPSAVGHLEFAPFIGSEDIYAIIPADAQPPLLTASIEGFLDIVRLLVESGADINMPNNDGFTPLHAASFYGYLEIAMILVEHGANTELTDENGKTALDYAEEEDHKEIADYLRNH